VSFGDEEWGFSDASLKPLQDALSELNPGYLRMYHNRVVLVFDDDQIGADAALKTFAALRSTEMFARFLIGFSEADSGAGWWTAFNAAIDSERLDSPEKRPNKAPEPTPTSVMPRANERRIE